MTDQELPRMARARLAELEQTVEELRLRLRKKRQDGDSELLPVSFRQLVQRLEAESGDGKVV